MSASYQYSGFLRRDGDAWTGELIDKFGWRIVLTGKLAEASDGKRELRITGVLGETPEKLRFDVEGATRE